MKPARAHLASIVILALTLALLTATGCRHVAPWQREAAADARMRWIPAPERGAAREHVLSVREGTQGGHGDHGSGCGCD